MFRPLVKRVITRRFLAAANNSNAHIEIRTLEDLAKLQSLDNVDPKLISKLINDKTNELNIKNELQMLKQLQAEEQKTQETSLKKFVRPAWIFLLMGSIVYLSCHYVWWKLDYEEKELEYTHKVHQLESELAALNEAHNSLASSEKNSKGSSRKWYKFW
ncbi:Ina17 [Kluyveromyces lactis]|nr:Ina17 [Kluyveromyces lactis]